MNGWKLVNRVNRPGARAEFVSRCVHRREHVRHYFLGETTESAAAPLFFFDDGVRGVDLVRWGMPYHTPVVLLRVQAQEPAPVIERVAWEETVDEYRRFWETVLAGDEWPRRDVFRTPAHTHYSPALTPLSVAWEGTPVRGQHEELAREIEAILRGVDFTIYLPVVGA